MMISVLVGALYLCYMMLPGDETGLPYPTTREQIIEHLDYCNKWLANTKYEFELIQARKETVCDNAPFAKGSRDIYEDYSGRYILRKSIQCRVKNLKKLLRKYEEIDRRNAMRDESHEPRFGTG